jgi:hypothetical protein
LIDKREIDIEVYTEEVFRVILGAVLDLEGISEVLQLNMRTADSGH